MKTQQIGRSSLTCTRLAYGCWRLVSTMEPSEVTAERVVEGARAVLAAYEAGYTHFDHADIYCRGVCEQVFGDTMRGVAGMRDRVLIGTKCGIRFAGDPTPGAPKHYDSSADHIVRSCEQSLKRLGTDRIDLFQIHRPDLLMHPQEVAAAFDRLKRAGKVLEFGVSNFLPSTLAALQAACPMPLAVHQVEIHLAKLDCLYDGTLDQCLTNGMTPLAWSPLGAGVLGTGNAVRGDSPRQQQLRTLQREMDDVAGRYDTTRSVVAVAWLLRHPAGILPIIGTNNPDRIAEAARADALELSRPDWYRLLIAARGSDVP
jgi:predicted oxidoreductase